MSHLLASLETVLVLVGVAQTPPPPTVDWAYVANSEGTTSAVFVDGPGGLRLSAQCDDGHFLVAIMGLPTTPSQFPVYNRRYDDGREEETGWHPIASGAGMATESPRLARTLRGERRLMLTVVSGRDEPREISFDLPAQSRNIDRVLTDCGLPLSDPFDGVLDGVGLLVEFPKFRTSTWDALSRERDPIQINVQCLIAAERLTACRSESEDPPNPRRGARLARSVNGTPVSVTDPTAAEGRSLTVVLTAAGY